MILRSGVDLIEIERLSNALGRYGERFLKRIYTPGELAECSSDCSQNIASLAARFAAKEATAKALGTGIGAVSWQEIEILHDSNGRPILTLSGQAEVVANTLGLSVWSLSISHTHAYAVALVVAMG